MTGETKLEVLQATPMNPTTNDHKLAVTTLLSGGIIPHASTTCPICGKPLKNRQTYCCTSCRVIAWQLRQLRKLLDEFYNFIEAKMKAGIFRF
jgi:predicted nucleic acid-binding Zn ribbon protein